MIDIIFELVIFVFGLFIGSLLNVIICRLNTGQDIIVSRSICPHCKHILSWRDLIPVFSFLFLGGRCRYCRKKISWQYPLMEIGTGLLLLLIFILPAGETSLPRLAAFLPRLALSPPRLTVFGEAGGEAVSGLGLQVLLTLIFLLIVFYSLIIIFVYDFKYYLIPDEIVYTAIIATFFYHFFHILGYGYLGYGAFRLLLNPFFSGLAASAFFLFLILVSRGQWMGWGDVKLVFFMGLFLGFPKILLALVLSVSIGSLVGIILMALGKKTLKSRVPFGPFLIIGTLISFFWGGQIIAWYIDVLSGVL